MPKFNAQFTKTFELEIEADDMKAAEAITTRFIAQFPAGTVRRLSIHPEGYVEPVTQAVTGVVDMAAERNTRLAMNVAKLTGQEPPEAA